LDYVQADATKPKHHALRARLHLGGVEHGADASGDAAADVADLIEGGVLADLGYCDLGQHGEIRERGGAHVVVQLLAFEREARRSVRHDALALRRSYGGAQVGLAREARRTLPAFGRVKGDDVVALLHAGHAWPDVDNDAGALMAEDSRKQPFGVGARQRELVGVTDAGGLHFHQYLSGLRTVEVDLGDDKRLGLFQCDSGAGFHGGFLLVILVDSIEMVDARGKSPLAMEPDSNVAGATATGPCRLPQTSAQDCGSLVAWANLRAMQNLSDANSLFKKTL
jgi:hypothetical protein